MAVVTTKAQPFTYVAHVLGIAAAVLVLVWCIYFMGGLAFVSTNKALIFNVSYLKHSFFFVCFTSSCYALAIISYKTLPLSKDTKKLVHLILHAIALVLGVVGIYAAFKFHNESNIANLYSIHSWIGLGTICLYGIQWIFGFVVFFYPGGSSMVRKESLPWHVVFGLFVYILAVTTAALGFLEKLTFLENSGLYKYGAEAFLVNFTTIVTILFGTFVVISAICPAEVTDDFSYSSIE